MEITDQNSRCGSSFSTYVCRKFTFRNFMRFVVGSECLVSFGTALVAGRQWHWGIWTVERKLEQRKRTGSFSWGGIKNVFWVFITLVWYTAAPVVHFE